MGASEILLVAITIGIAILPPFLFGLAGGLWCYHVRTSALVGLAIGILAVAMPLTFQSRNPMVLWEETAPRLFLFFVVPAVLGGLSGPKVRSRTLQPYPVGLTIFVCVLGTFGYMLLLPAWSPARAIARQRMCTDNLKQIGLALSRYAKAHGAHVPSESGAKGLDYLVREGFIDKMNILCPWDETRHAARTGEPLTEATCSYVYVGGTLRSESYTNVVPICWDKIENHRGMGLNVLFNDGHVQWVTLRQWEKIKPSK